MSENIIFAPQASPDKPQSFTLSNKPHFFQVRAEKSSLLKKDIPKASLF